MHKTETTNKIKINDVIYKITDIDNHLTITNNKTDIKLTIRYSAGYSFSNVLTFDLTKQSMTILYFDTTANGKEIDIIIMESVGKEKTKDELINHINYIMEKHEFIKEILGEFVSDYLGYNFSKLTKLLKKLNN